MRVQSASFTSLTPRLNRCEQLNGDGPQLLGASRRCGSESCSRGRKDLALGFQDSRTRGSSVVGKLQRSFRAAGLEGLGPERKQRAPKPFTLPAELRKNLPILGSHSFPGRLFGGWGGGGGARQASQARDPPKEPWALMPGLGRCRARGWEALR